MDDAEQRAEHRQVHARPGAGDSCDRGTAGRALVLRMERGAAARDRERGNQAV
jgi:hypothetical protein